MSSSLKVLAISFNPVQSQSMQKSTQTLQSGQLNLHPSDEHQKPKETYFHQAQNSDRAIKPQATHKHESDPTANTLRREEILQCHRPKNLR